MDFPRLPGGRLPGQEGRVNPVPVFSFPRLLLPGVLRRSGARILAVLGHHAAAW